MTRKNAQLEPNDHIAANFFVYWDTEKTLNCGIIPENGTTWPSLRPVPRELPAGRGQMDKSLALRTESSTNQSNPNAFTVDFSQWHPFG